MPAYLTMVPVQLLTQRVVRVVGKRLQLRFHRGAQQRRVHKLLALFEHVLHRLLCAGSNRAILKAVEEDKEEAEVAEVAEVNSKQRGEGYA